MRCLNPIRLKNPNFPESSSLRYIDCACGKCFPCLVNRRRMWYFRLLYESLFSSSHTSFVSLDYAPAFCDMNLHKLHLQCYFKKLRKYFNFKYYAIGEFGTDPDGTHRPHYHILFFFNSSNDFSYESFQVLCRNYWKYGRVKFGDVEPRSINYVLHYHVRPKKPFGDDDPRKTFCLFSKGLGLSFIDSQLYNLLSLLESSSQRSVVNLFGDSFVLPRYYSKKLKEYGFPVMEFDGSDIDWSQSNLRSLLEKLDDTIRFDHEGRPFKEYDDRVNSLVSDIMKESKRMLDKYNLQKKLFGHG